jgi:hypothetical protein
MRVLILALLFIVGCGQAPSQVSQAISPSTVTAGSLSPVVASAPVAYALTCPTGTYAISATVCMDLAPRMPAVDRTAAVAACGIYTSNAEHLCSVAEVTDSVTITNMVENRFYWTSTYSPSSGLYYGVENDISQAMNTGDLYTYFCCVAGT